MTPFSIVCFLALVDHHGEGWGHTHPSYLAEKFGFKTDEDAYGVLDRINQERVLRYCEKWRMPLPHCVEEYEKSFK